MEAVEADPAVPPSLVALAPLIALLILVIAFLSGRADEFQDAFEHAIEKRGQAVEEGDDQAVAGWDSVISRLASPDSAPGEDREPRTYFGVTAPDWLTAGVAIAGAAIGAVGLVAAAIVGVRVAEKRRGPEPKSPEQPIRFQPEAAPARTEGWLEANLRWLAGRVRPVGKGADAAEEPGSETTE